MAKELDRFDPNPKKNVSLKTKLIAMIAGASFIGVAVTATLSLTVFDKGLMNQTIEDLGHITDGVEWILQDWLDTLGGYGDMLASTDHIKGYLDGSYTDDANAYLKEKATLCGVDLLAITDIIWKSNSRLSGKDWRNIKLEFFKNCSSWKTGIFLWGLW